MNIKCCTKCGLIKTIEEFPRRKSNLTGLYSWCKECCSRINKKYYQKNSEIIRKRASQYVKDNKKNVNEKNKKWRKEHPESVKNFRKKYYIKKRQDQLFLEEEKARKRRDWIENKAKRKKASHLWKQKNKERNKQITRNWSIKNKARRAALQMKRKAQLLNAMPKWANEGAIKAIYLEAENISKETGILHHVDHIIPLLNDKVCGLHVENNLRIIPAIENLKKGSQLERKAWL